MKIIKSNYRGFTLVEMAIVLVIAGILLSAIIGIGNSLVAQSRISATKTKQEAIKTALISYIARNNRMPCPAVPNIAPPTPLAPTIGYGVEADTPGTCAGVPFSGAGAARVVNGLIPWLTLGLSDESGEDGYYNRFSYSVTSDATNLTRNTVAGMLGNITIHTSSPTVLGLPPAGNQSNVCTPAGGLLNPCLMVAVITSHGANANGAYTRSGTQIAMPAGADELDNANIDSTFIQKEFANGANPFDDIVLSLSPSELLSPLTLHGSLKDSNTALRDNFDAITAAATTIAAINRVGAPNNRIYRLPLTNPDLNLPAVNTTDPWGNQIIYNVITSNINPTTVDGVAFNLISLGPDGAISVDDITSTVRISELQSKFTNYGW